MARIISLIVLGVFVVLVAVIFFWVMAGFILPLFLATVLTVLFHPLHQWFVRKCKGYDRIAAVLTLVTILVIVLAPLIAVLFRAANDATDLVQESNVHVDTEGISQLVGSINERFGLELNPEEIRQTVRARVQDTLEPLARRTPAFLGNFLIGLIVMIVALYYFLVDGDDMIANITRLLPLETRYQHQLLSEFDKVSRAVVTATLLSALAQGLLAGIAFKIAGLEPLFMLIMLTMVGSMIPFVGAAAVWVSCAAWLFFVQERTGMAIFMVVYGVAIISTVDNLIKPIVLHGQSKLHPLLALLSVLGGVRALGPIGVFVGPMAVAFLQAGLNMLHFELGTLNGGKSPPANVAG